MLQRAALAAEPIAAPIHRHQPMQISRYSPYRITFPSPVFPLVVFLVGFINVIPAYDTVIAAVTIFQKL